MFSGCDVIASLKRGTGPFLFVAIDLFIDRPLYGLGQSKSPFALI